MRTPGHSQRDMSCQQAREAVTDYLESALPEPQQAALERHLLDCPACRDYLAEMQYLIRAMAGLSQKPVSQSPAVREKVLQLFRQWELSRQAGTD